MTKIDYKAKKNTKDYTKKDIIYLFVFGIVIAIPFFIYIIPMIGGIDIDININPSLRDAWFIFQKCTVLITIIILSLALINEIKNS